MVVTLRRAVVAQLTQPRRDGRIVGDDRPGFAVRTQILRIIEAEAPGVAERAGPATVAASAVGLTRILDDRRAVVPRDRANSNHVRQATVEVDRDDCACARSEVTLEVGWIHCKRRRI